MSEEPWRNLRGRGIRVDRNLYGIAHQVTAITIGTHQRRPVFQNDDFASACVRDLRVAGEREDVSVPAFCFMPDHVHLLLQPETDVDLVAFIQGYKSWTTRLAWKHGIHGKLWQRSFYDHILRRDEELEKHLYYIVENPVRAGLVQDWREYPYSGSFLFDLQTMDWP